MLFIVLALFHRHPVLESKESLQASDSIERKNTILIVIECCVGQQFSIQPQPRQRVPSSHMTRICISDAHSRILIIISLSYENLSLREFFPTNIDQSSAEIIVFPFWEAIKWHAESVFSSINQWIVENFLIVFHFSWELLFFRGRNRDKEKTKQKSRNNAINNFFLSDHSPILSSQITERRKPNSTTESTQWFSAADFTILIIVFFVQFRCLFHFSFLIESFQCS